MVVAICGGKPRKAQTDRPSSLIGFFSYLFEAPLMQKMVVFSTELFLCMQPLI